MKMIVEKFYVIINKDNEYFNIDSLSGGYPCYVDSLSIAFKFKSKEEAYKFMKDDYANKFKGVFDNTQVKCITITMEDV